MMKPVMLAQLVLLKLLSFAAGAEVTTTKYPEYKVSVYRSYLSASDEQVESIVDGIESIRKDQSRMADSLESLSQCGGVGTTSKPVDPISAQQCCADKMSLQEKFNSCQKGRSFLQSLVGDRQTNLENSLRDAGKHGRVEEIKSILSAGANASAADGSGHTALHWAAYKGQVSAVKELLKGGANIEAQDNSKQTPLHWASRGDSTDAVATLLEAGANVNALDSKMDTPLHVAASNDREDAAQLLLDNGANPDLKNKDNKTPLNVAGGKVKKILLAQK